MERPNEKIHWLPQQEYDKAVGQLRMQIATALHPLRLYGQDIYVDAAIANVVSLAEDFGLRVRGIDVPISLDLVRRK